MSILQDFFYGEILPWEQFGSSNDPAYKMYSNNITNMENSLMESMDEKEQKMFMELRDQRITQANMELERMFLYAFRMGVRFAIDIHSE